MKTLKLTFVFSLFVTIVNSQAISSQEIDKLVERTLTAFDVPGIAVAVVKDGKVIHSKGYGVRSLSNKLPVDENTLFGIASNSKAFTTTALGILVDEGKIAWDDKVRDYIPEFKLYDPYVTEAFTIRDLVTHRSGLGLGAGDLMFFPDSSNFTVNDIIHNLRFLKPVSAFRTKYDYDNNLYIVAGEVIARVSGLNWDDFITRRILQPLQMNNSGASFDAIKSNPNIIDAHAPVDGKVQVIARNSLKIGHSAGGIYSSIADLSKWVIMHLNSGKYGPNLNYALISKENHAELLTPQTIIPVRNPGAYNSHFSAYGLGFFLQDVKGYKQVAHTGGLEGMVTQITMIPELNLGIIVLTNQQEGLAFTSITNQIKDTYLGVTGTDRLNQYAKMRAVQINNGDSITNAVWKVVASNSSKNNNNIIGNSSTVLGTYTDQWFGQITISNKNGKMWFQSQRSPQLKGEMFYYSANNYVVKWLNRSFDADAFVYVGLDMDGNANSIKMKAISPLTDFSYDFHDLDFRKVTKK
jgi:CubicO group peptidase (beta-lactamase class C family)